MTNSVGNKTDLKCVKMTLFQPLLLSTPITLIASNNWEHFDSKVLK